MLLPGLKCQCVKCWCVFAVIPHYSHASGSRQWWHVAVPGSCCLGVDRKVLCLTCKYLYFRPQEHNFFFPTEMLWYGNDQNMVWFQKRYTNFLVLGIKILLSGNTFCVKWWICSCDLCKWLSGGFVAHPVLAVKYSFLVTYDILDEFSWLANVLHNCQNFAMVFLGNIEKGEVSSSSHFFCTVTLFSLVLFYLPCPVAFWKPLS